MTSPQPHSHTHAGVPLVRPTPTPVAIPSLNSNDVVDPATAIHRTPTPDSSSAGSSPVSSVMAMSASPTEPLSLTQTQTDERSCDTCQTRLSPTTTTVQTPQDSTNSTIVAHLHQSSPSPLSSEDDSSYSMEEENDDEDEEAEECATERVIIQPFTPNPAPTLRPRRTSASLSSPAPMRTAAYRSPRPRVLVTGGAGFIGSHLCRALLQRGEDIVLVDELNDYYDPAIKVANLRSLLDEFGSSRCHVYVADVCDEAAMRSCLQQENVDRVAHLAARAGVRPSIQNPFIYEHSNVRGTLTLLELAAHHRTSNGERAIKHFVYASSSSVYGDRASVPFRETDACNTPASIYAATKKSCELLASSYSSLYQLPCSGLRFFYCLR